MYFLCSLHSQKAASLARDRRISLTIDCDTFDARRSQVFRWQLRPSESATQLKSPRLWICFRRDAPIHSDPEAETGGHHRLSGCCQKLVSSTTLRGLRTPISSIVVIEGPLSKSTTAVQPRRQELLFMPDSGHCPSRTQTAQLVDCGPSRFARAVMCMA